MAAFPKLACSCLAGPVASTFEKSSSRSCPYRESLLEFSQSSEIGLEASYLSQHRCEVLGRDHAASSCWDDILHSPFSVVSERLQEYVILRAKIMLSIYYI
jgi:hypothetical protein